MDPAEPNKPQRTFPPLYKGTGNEGQDRLAFIHILERLKASWVCPGMLNTWKLIVVDAARGTDSKTNGMGQPQGLTFDRAFKFLNE
jgi:hypothetical protein